MPDDIIGITEFKCFVTQKLIFFQIIFKNLELQAHVMWKAPKVG